MVDYKALEEDLRNCFEKRNIQIEEIKVVDGATKYIIKVKRD